MRRLRQIPTVAVVLLVLLAFALGVAAERWLNGSRREQALERYERAVREYGGEAGPAQRRP
ncbi:MAG TPA: hypothetical protein VIM86_06010 [Thermodesulfobacteriota bacterium]